MKRVIHWFRRDLRLHDNTGLSAALDAAPEVDAGLHPEPVARSSPLDRRAAPAISLWLAGSPRSESRNTRRPPDHPPGRRRTRNLGSCCTRRERRRFSSIATRTPLGGKWRKRSRRWPIRSGHPSHALQDIAIHERDEVLTGKGEPYRVFTPYSKAWRKLPKAGRPRRPRRIHTPPGIASLPLPTLDTGGCRPTRNHRSRRRRRRASGSMPSCAARSAITGSLRDFPVARQPPPGSRRTCATACSPRARSMRGRSMPREGATPERGGEASISLYQ